MILYIKTTNIIRMGSDKMAYIELKKINKIYKVGEIEVKALNNTSFKIEKGELVCILGPSGAGKTTCLNILGGMDTATSGSLKVDNKEITNLKRKELINYRRNDIGFVFQFHNLIQNLTCIRKCRIGSSTMQRSLRPKRNSKKSWLKR